MDRNGIQEGIQMPSFWKRSALAGLIAAGMTGWTANAQQPQPVCENVKCTQMGIPHPSWQPGNSPADQPGDQTPWTPGEASPSETEPVPTPDSPMPETSPEPAPIQTPADQAMTPPDTTADLSFGSAQGGLGDVDLAFSGSPNMIGDLLRGYRGITFSYLQAGDFAVANTSGTVNFRNTKVAENNSAVPRDRFTFRYNYFKNALQVNGLQPSPELGPRIRQDFGAPFRQFHTVQPASKSYSVHLYTLGLEKTFLDNMASIEVRVPFARTIDSNLNLVSGDYLFDVPNTVPLIQPTPGRTLGDADTEMQDMNVILKTIIAQDAYRRWVVSAGLGVTIPTGEDLNATVVDYSNDVPGDPGDAVFVRQPNQFAFDQRTRQFHIDNSTWGLSPFLAAAATPSDRTFFNGFVQVDCPVNSSDWTFRETDRDLEILFDPYVVGSNPNAPASVQAIQFDRTLSGTIRDQYLLHLDVGGGYWLYRNPTKRHLKGIAGLMELHYTGTLDSADIVTVRETPIRTVDASGLVGPLAPPRLGNIANRLDILNFTVGSTILVGKNAAISTAYVAPLRSGMNRTFDGELNVQLNWYR